MILLKLLAAVAVMGLVRTAAAAIPATNTSTAATSATPIVLPVWPDLDPSLQSSEQTEEHGTAAKPAPFIKDVRYPTLTVYLPQRSDAPTSAVVICPGGGYSGVSIDKEGHDVARWLNSLGIAGVVLKYRMPHAEASQGQTPLPLLDAREAIRMVRLHNADWNIDPHRIGIMGFSAGGHLAATVITHPGPPDTQADFAVLVYPVITMKDPVAHKGSRENLLGKNPAPALIEQYSAELHVTPQTVPTFLVQAKDDRVDPQNSILFYGALQRQHVPAELHLLNHGGHGFGLGVNGGEPATWPGMCEKWMVFRGLIDPQALAVPAVPPGSDTPSPVRAIPSQGRTSP